MISILVKELLGVSLSKLGNRYSVDAKYVLSEKVEEEFQRCLSIGTQAFLTFIDKKTQKSELIQSKLILDYLKSSTVTEEIWHLLDPGLEFFDKRLVTKHACESLPQIFGESTEIIIFDAWEEFLKSFSFASRAAPELREFLRASYEAGSFRALSNIEDVLERLGGAISNLQDEELTVSNAIELYADELKVYRTWAINFQTN